MAVPLKDGGLLADFELERVLSEDAVTKHAALLGRFAGKEGRAVLVLSRRHFPLDRLQQLVAGTRTSLQFNNDIYSKLMGTPPEEDSAISVDVVYPATDKHVLKHSTQQYFVVLETPETYAEVTQPFIASIPAARIQWVYNILERKALRSELSALPKTQMSALTELPAAQAEVERLLFEDPDPETGFMLHPDLKWDQTQPQSLYCIALCHRRDVQSLRDLRPAHLSLLRNIRNKGRKAIEQHHGIPPHQLRIFVHYQPSYYHFHVHFCHTGLGNNGPGAAVGKAHLLDDIIDNISSIAGDFYARRTLSCVLGANDPLLEAHRKRKRRPDAEDQL